MKLCGRVAAVNATTVTGAARCGLDSESTLMSSLPIHRRRYYELTAGNAAVRQGGHSQATHCPARSYPSKYPFDTGHVAQKLIPSAVEQPIIREPYREEHRVPIRQHGY